MFEHTTDDTRSNILMETVVQTLKSAKTVENFSSVTLAQSQSGRPCSTPPTKTETLHQTCFGLT